MLILYPYRYTFKYPIKERNQKMTAIKNTKLLVSMPQNLADDVTEFAKELNQNKSALINQALEFYFDHLDLQIAKKRSLEKNKTISLSQMRKLSDESI